MNNHLDYQIHEHLYRDLKNSGAEGWGGESFSSRMQQWDLAIDELMRNVDFPKPPAQVLEIGSGAGDVSLRVAQKGYKVTGVDISDTAVEWAREKTKSLRNAPVFYHGNACDLNRFNDEVFEVVIDGNCFHCIIGEDRKSFLSEARRVLQPKGLLFLSSMVGQPKEMGGPDFRFDFKTRCQMKSGVAYRYMGLEDDVLEEVTQAGFQILKSKTNIHPWWDHLTCLALKA